MAQGSGRSSRITIPSLLVDEDDLEMVDSDDSGYRTATGRLSRASSRSGQPFRTQNSPSTAAVPAAATHRPSSSHRRGQENHAHHQRIARDNDDRLVRIGEVILSKLACPNLKKSKQHNQGKLRHFEKPHTQKALLLASTLLFQILKVAEEQGQIQQVLKEAARGFHYGGRLRDQELAGVAERLLKVEWAGEGMGSMWDWRLEEWLSEEDRERVEGSAARWAVGAE